MAIDRVATPFMPQQGGEELEIIIENPDSVSLLDEDSALIVTGKHLNA